MIPAIAALTAASYEGRERALAYALLGGVAAIAIAAGPLIGGWVTTEFSWRYVFASETVVVIFLLLLRGRIPRAAAAERRPRLDLVGVALSASGLGLIVFAILRSSVWGFVQPRTRQRSTARRSLAGFAGWTGPARCQDREHDQAEPARGERHADEVEPRAPLGGRAPESSHVAAGEDHYDGLGGGRLSARGNPSVTHPPITGLRRWRWRRPHRVARRQAAAHGPHSSRRGGFAAIGSEHEHRTEPLEPRAAIRQDGEVRAQRRGE